MRTIAVVSAVVVVLGACTSAAEVTTTTSAPETTTTETIPPSSDRGEAETYEVGIAVTHPNGAQLRFERIQYFESATVVEMGISNGSRFGIELGRGVTELISGAGETALLSQPLSVHEVGSGEDAALSIVFAPLADRSSVTLRVNHGRGASPRGSSTNAPSFTVGPIALNASATRPGLPPPVPLDRSVVADGGAELRIDGLVFTQNRIGVSVMIENRSQGDVSISPSAVPSFLVDDVGNPYFLVMPEGEGFISIPAGQARRGVLSFAGRIDPTATSLTIGINDDRTDRRYAQYPRFVVEDMPITGDVFAAAPPPAAFTIGAELAHPAGLTLQVGDVRFVAGSVEVDVVATNTRSESIGLADEPTFVVDDLGVGLPLQPPASNRRFLVAANSMVEATIVFHGLPGPEATSISLIFNEGGSTTDAEAAAPSFTFGPYPLTRATAEPVTLEARVFPVDSRSVLVSAELTVVETEIQAVASILRQFDATPVEGGFRLTLPDDILFDFGSSQLREDALQSLSLIRDVLDYFEGDQVVVVGHTDSIGSSSANQTLSLNRATSVVDALVERLGIDRGRLGADGRGASEPVAPNTNADGSDNPDGRQLNRRVEIFVLTDRALPEG